jgi:hypothetical protein
MRAMAANPKELGVIKVAKPCHSDWETMTGDERARFCSECKLNVYDLSAMSSDEARELIREKEGHLCVRFYSRPDGRVITRDCPVGITAYRRRLVVVGASALSLSVLGLAAVLEEEKRRGQLDPRELRYTMGRMSSIQVIRGSGEEPVKP